MRIAIDGRALEVGGGVHNYTRNLIKYLPLVDSDNVYYLFSTDRFSHLGGIRTLPLKSAEGPLPNNILEVLSWEQLRVPLAASRHHIDVLHAPKHVGPLLTSSKLVATIWDSAYFDHPEFYGSWEAFYWRVMSRLTARRADAIIVASRSARDDLIAKGFPANKMHVVPIAAGDEFRPVREQAVIDQVLDKYGVPRESGYLFFAGDIEPKKNLETMLEAFAIVKRKGFSHKLVIAGKSRSHYRDQMLALRADLGLDDEVAFVGFVDQTDLPALYSGAEVFLFPSRYEGFGLPPLEAISCGTPAIVSKAGSLPEVIGDGGISLDSDDTELWAESILRVLEDGELRNALVGSALRRARQFSWRRTAQITRATYERVCDRTYAASN